jgi:hypothetical protein
VYRALNFAAELTNKQDYSQMCTTSLKWSAAVGILWGMSYWSGTVQSQRGQSIKSANCNNWNVGKVLWTGSETLLQVASFLVTMKT